MKLCIKSSSIYINKSNSIYGPTKEYKWFSTKTNSVYNTSLIEYKNDLIAYLEGTLNMDFNGEQIFIPNYGFSCIENNQDFLRDNRDAQYWNVADNFKLNNNSFYVVLGIIHYIRIQI